MKKNIIIGFVLVGIGAGSVFALEAMLPSRVEIAEKNYNETAQQREFWNQKELSEFCLLVKLKEADGVEISNSDSIERFKNECDSSLFQ